MASWEHWQGLCYNSQYHRGRQKSQTAGFNKNCLLFPKHTLVFSLVRSSVFVCSCFRITSFCKVHTQFKVTTTAQYLENWVIAYLLPNWSVVVAVWTECAKSQTHGRLCFETFSDVPSYLCPPSHSLWWPTCSLQRERHLKVSSSWLGGKNRLSGR